MSSSAVVGSCTDKCGDDIDVYLDGDEVLVDFTVDGDTVDGDEVTMRFDREHFAAFRELLDRAAMPAQVSS